MKPSPCPHCKKEFTSFNARRKHLKAGKYGETECQRQEREATTMGMAHSYAPEPPPPAPSRPYRPSRSLLAALSLIAVDGRREPPRRRVVIDAPNPIADLLLNNKPKTNAEPVRAELIKRGATELAPGVFGLKKDDER